MERSLLKAGVVIASLTACAPLAAQQVVYVSASASGGNTGTSWADAFTDLQDAMAIVASGDEIWIAAGTYRPDRRTGNHEMSFVVPDGVDVYGGFAGWETSLDHRILGQNESVLSGDLAGDDGPHNCAEVSNCCVAHDGFGCDTPSCEARVCAIYPDCCEGWDDPKYFEWDLNCPLIARRECCDLGSWNSCENSAVVVRAFGGKNGVLLDGLVASGAFAPYEQAGGAGVWVTSGGLTLRNCVMRAHGRYALRFDGSAGLNVDDSDFVDNVGSAILHGQGAASVRRSSFLRNGSGVFGQADLTVEGCVFEGNLHASIFNDGKLTVRNSSFINNEGNVIDHAPFSGPGYYVGCEFANNMGSILEDNGLFRDCTFRGNGSDISTIGAVSLINCLVHGTRSSAFNGGSFRLTNCTVLGVGVAFKVGGIFGETVAIDNSVLFGNSVAGLGWIYTGSGASVTVNHSIVEGWEGEFPGVGTFDADPLFVDPLGPDGVPGTEDDDLRLSAGSPAINAGAITASLPTTDLDGHPRVLCGAVDIGAYEFGTADVYCDGAVGPLEVETFVLCLTGPDLEYSPGTCLSFDANTDGAIDLSDFAFLQRAFNGE